MLMDLKGKISTQEDFAEIAQEHSDCGSARSGGDLGEFGDGQMMKVLVDVTPALAVTFVCCIHLVVTAAVYIGIITGTCIPGTWYGLYVDLGP